MYCFIILFNKNKSFTNTLGSVPTRTLPKPFLIYISYSQTQVVLPTFVYLAMSGYVFMFLVASSGRWYNEHSNKEFSSAKMSTVLLLRNPHIH